MKFTKYFLIGISFLFFQTLLAKEPSKLKFLDGDGVKVCGFTESLGPAEIKFAINKGNYSTVNMTYGDKEKPDKMMIGPDKEKKLSLQESKEIYDTYMKGFEKGDLVYDEIFVAATATGTFNNVEKGFTIEGNSGNGIERYTFIKMKHQDNYVVLESNPKDSPAKYIFKGSSSYCKTDRYVVATAPKGDGIHPESKEVQEARWRTRNRTSMQLFGVKVGEDFVGDTDLKGKDPASN